MNNGLLSAKLLFFTRRCNDLIFLIFFFDIRDTVLGS